MFDRLKEQLLRQVHINYLGAFIVLTLSVFSVMGILMFALNTRVIYYNVGDPGIRVLFPTYLTFILTLLSVWVVAMICWHKFAVPSINRYNATQSIIHGHPLMEKLEDMDKKINLLIQEREEKQ